MIIIVMYSSYSEWRQYVKNKPSYNALHNKYEEDGNTYFGCHIENYHQIMSIECHTWTIFGTICLNAEILGQIQRRCRLR